MQAFIVCLASFLFVVLLFPAVACCWCGDEAAAGFAPLPAGASGVRLEVASRWCGLEAALGDVGSEEGGVWPKANPMIAIEVTTEEIIRRHMFMGILQDTAGLRRR